MDLLSHVPSFGCRVTANGERCIYDGDHLVGALYEGTEPLGSIAKPVSLHDLRLIPGGAPFIARGEGCGALCLSWRKHLIFQPAIDELNVDDSDPRKLRLYVKTHDAGLRADQPQEPPYRPGNATEETWLELTYDPTLPSYVYDVRTRMSISSDRVEAMLARDLRGLEFGDILPAGCNDRFQPGGGKRYQWYVYKGRDGRLYKLPHNHSRGPERRGILYGKDGYIAFVTEADCNPVIQFMGNAGLRVFSEICHAMFDVHFKLNRDEEIRLLRAGEPLEVHYRIHSVPQARAAQILDDALFDPKLEDPLSRLPLYALDGVNRFEPSEDYLKPTDQWPWQPSDSNCIWDLDAGYEGKGSLKISRDNHSGSSHWACDRAVIELRTYQLHRPIDGRFHIRAMVRTDGVTARVRVGLEFAGLTPEGWWQPRPPQYAETELTDTNDWALIELITTPGNGAVGAKILLEHEGAGQSWFDDVRICPMA